MSALLILLNTIYDYLGTHNDSLKETDKMVYIKILFLIILLTSLLNLFCICTL